MATNALPQNQFGSVIRVVKRGGIETVMAVRNATYTTLRRLGVKRDRTKAVAGMPRGSDQVDMRSIVEWLARVERDDAEASAQIVAIDATAVDRTEG